MNNSSHQATEQLITPAQAAQLLGVKEGTLSVWRSTGRYDIPYVKIGRRVKYRPSDLDAYINNHKYHHTGSKVSQSV